LIIKLTVAEDFWLAVSVGKVGPALLMVKHCKQNLQQIECFPGYRKAG
jgi:hypothetical protein